MTDADMPGDPLAYYDSNGAFRAAIIDMYRTNRPRFVASVISLAVSEGFGRQESVVFANAVTARLRAEISDVTEQICRHCGRKTGITYGTVPIGGGFTAKLCHTSNPNRPDCYRRVTVYHESLGILRIADPVPNGVANILGRAHG